MTETARRPSPLTLEQRLTHLENELRTAQARLADLSASRATAARVRGFEKVLVALLLLGCVWIVPTPAAATDTFTVPFTVKSATTGASFVVDENGFGTGLLAKFSNAGGASVLGVGVDANGMGLVASNNPDASSRVVMGIDATGGPVLRLTQGGQKVADLGPRATTNAIGLRFFNNGQAIVGLGNKGGKGYLILGDQSGVTRLEAGTDTNGNGSVRVYGPTGQCGIVLVNVPCMLLAR